jgi:hypothetical protein
MYIRARRGAVTASREKTGPANNVILQEAKVLGETKASWRL